MRHKAAIVLAVVGFAALFAAVVVLARPGVASSASKRGADIGTYPNYDEAMRAALRQIAADMRREPTARRFRVQWNASWLAVLRLEPMDSRCLEYDRDRQTLLESDEGGESGWSGVSQAMISRAASERSPFEAFKQYGCSEFP